MTAIFPDRKHADLAYDAVADHGYSRDEISVMMSDETRRNHFDDGVEVTHGTKAAEGAGVGGTIGGAVGAVLAAIVAGVSTVALPGIGLVIAGPIAAALAGAGAGGVAGTVVGALIGAGIPEDRARHYEEGIRRGGIVLGVHPHSAEDADYIAEKWHKYEGEEIYH
jgi:hypothetical protein